MKHTQSVQGSNCNFKDKRASFLQNRCQDKVVQQRKQAGKQKKLDQNHQAKLMKLETKYQEKEAKEENVLVNNCLRSKETSFFSLFFKNKAKVTKCNPKIQQICEVSIKQEQDTRAISEQKQLQRRRKKEEQTKKKQKQLRRKQEQKRKQQLQHQRQLLEYQIFEQQRMKKLEYVNALKKQLQQRQATLDNRQNQRNKKGEASVKYFQWFFNKNKLITVEQVGEEYLKNHEKCPICYGDFQEDISDGQNQRHFVQNDEGGEDEEISHEYLTKLYCNHVFHTECIKKWLKKNPQCAICRQDFRQHSNYARWDPDYRQRIQKINHQLQTEILILQNLIGEKQPETN